MKIYDIVNEVNLARIGDIASDLWKGVTAIRSKSQLISRLDPFIETSSTKYAEAVLDARAKGKVADPNPYTVLQKDLDPNLTPEQLKVILDEVSKRAQPKIKSGKTGTAPKAQPTTQRPEYVDAVPPTERPPKPQKPSRAPNDTLPRQKIGDVEANTLFQKAAGNSVNVLKYLGVGHLGMEYWKEQGTIEKDLKAGTITQEQYTALTRENRQVLASKILALGLGIKLARAIATGGAAVVGTITDWLTFGLASRDRAVVLAVLGSEATATIFATKYLEGNDADKFIAGIVQNTIDPTWEWAVNGVVPKEWMIKSMETIMKEQEPAAAPAPTNQTQGSAAPNTPAPATNKANQSGQPATGNSEFDDLMRGAGLKQ